MNHSFYVPKGSTKVIATKGTRQVDGLVKGERGEHVTAHICFSATGVYVPPLIIFPRARFNPAFLEGKPEGAIVEFHSSGYMTVDIFLTWMKHFISFTQPSDTKYVLLTFDGHATHVKNVPALTLAKESHVVAIVFPPHCTHKVQPVDVSFNKPLSSYMAAESSTWTRRNRKKNLYLTFKTLFQVLIPAYNRAATKEIAVSGFRKTGIHPFNKDIFTDEDFVAGTILDHSRIQLEPLGLY